MSMGRNDPCYCNSGKEYKNCHMRQIHPREYFDVKITRGLKSVEYFEENAKGERKIIDGIIAMRLTFKDPLFDDSDISNLLSPLSKIANNIDSYLNKRTNRLHHKLCGVKYHKNNFLTEEENKIRKFNASYQAENIEYSFDNSKLIYETEGFLFQIKSSLDILAQIIGITFNFKECTTYKDDGETLLKQLENNCTTQLKDLGIRFKEAIATNKKWLMDVIDMRDEVTHYSDLEGFLCFMHKAWLGGEYARIYYPSMPDGTRVRNYMEDTWNSLLAFYQGMVPLISEAYQRTPRLGIIPNNIDTDA